RRGLRRGPAPPRALRRGGHGPRAPERAARDAARQPLPAQPRHVLRPLLAREARGRRAPDLQPHGLGAASVPDLVVVGGGISGASLAFRAARAGRAVVVVEADGAAG